MSKLSLALILAAMPLCAEFLHVEQSVTGLECASCAESAPRNLKKIKGVESASFRTSDSVAVLDLKPGNTVPLGDIRDACKRMGYTPAGSKVVVKGQARSEGGKWVLKVAGLDTDYSLDVSAGKEIEAQLRFDGPIVVEGSIGGLAAGTNAPIKVSAVHRAE